ncbi:MAG: DUF2807 domain-containing protein [Myxococcaceae bacterium]
MKSPTTFPDSGSKASVIRASSLDSITTQLTIHTSGGSRVRADELAASKVDVTLSGAGTARVQVADELGATLSGASTLTVIGNPTIVRRELSDASRLLTE